MISRITCSILLVAIPALSSCGQPKLDCQAVLAKKIDGDISIVVENVKRCGEFSGDDTLLLQGPILGPQMVLLANNKTTTYRDLVAKLDEIRHVEYYPEILQALKTERNSSPRPADARPLTVSFKKMDNYQLAVKEAIDSHKPLFLYFTSKNCVNSRQMENGLLAENDVKSILDKYVRYVANVDDDAIAKFQTEKFKSDVSPYFVVIKNDRKIAEFTGQTRDKDEFINFLKKGLK
jgi:hypothetical protein